ncbi:MAG: hypothetical protein DLM68_19680 [Hyphomicrobiales bacterium]|nr:MAG: hypothetical protein DLM68_19680 [Hyphomicrobiales bacterium]
MGYYQEVNLRPYGNLSHDWLSKLEPYAPRQITGDFIKRLEWVLINYIKNRAGTLAATPWHDKERGLIDGLEAINTAVRALLSAVDKSVPATSYILQRLEQIKEPHFARDDFYPQLSQLNWRTHLLLEELRAEEERGDALPMRSAWWSFVFGIATIYRDLGGSITVSKVSGANQATTKHSKFVKFAHAAMLEFPCDLREHTAGNHGNINSFSDALSDEIGRLRGLEGHSQKNEAAFSLRLRANGGLSPSIRNKDAP